MVRQYLRAAPAIFIALLLVAGLAAAAVGRTADRPAVYSVAALASQLTHHPRGWLGRTVLVRGVAQVTGIHTFRPGCEQSPLCVVVQPAWRLDDPETPDLVGSLPLRWGDPDPLRALLRGLPLIGRLAPPPQVADPGMTALYRIQLRAVPHSAQYEAVLLDVAPSAP